MAFSGCLAVKDPEEKKERAARAPVWNLAHRAVSQEGKQQVRLVDQA